MRHFYFWISCVFLLIATPSESFSCSEGLILPVNITTGSGKVGNIEKIKIVLNPDDTKARKAYEIDDDDGVLNLTMFVPLMANMDQKQINELGDVYKESLRKSIKYEEDFVKFLEKQSKNPQWNKTHDLGSILDAVKGHSDALKISRTLLKKIETNSLTKGDMGIFATQIVPLLKKGSGLKYQYSEFKNGKFEKVNLPEPRSLEEILTPDVYRTLLDVGENGNASPWQGRCKGFKAYWANGPKSTVSERNTGNGVQAGSR